MTFPPKYFHSNLEFCSLQSSENLYSCSSILVKICSSRIVFLKIFLRPNSRVELFFNSGNFLYAFFGFPRCSSDTLIYFRLSGFFLYLYKTRSTKKHENHEIFFGSSRKTEYTGAQLSIFAIHGNFPKRLQRPWKWIETCKKLLFLYFKWVWYTGCAK